SRIEGRECCRTPIRGNRGHSTTFRAQLRDPRRRRRPFSFTKAMGDSHESVSQMAIALDILVLAGHAAACDKPAVPANRGSGDRGSVVNCRSKRRRSPEQGPAMSEETIFVTALEKITPVERAAYLEAACGGDLGLRRRVEALLRAHEQSGDL